MDTHIATWDAAGADRAVAVLKAVADPTRYRLLWLLARREQSVGQLAEQVGAHVAAVSQHLARLRSAGLVGSRREGTRIFYRAAGPHVRGLLEEASLVASAADAEGGAGRPGEPAGTPDPATADARPAPHGVPRPVTG